MFSIMADCNGRPSHQATMPVYLDAIQRYGWEAVHRQMLTELSDGLTQNRQDISPRQRVEYAHQWQQLLLSAVKNACSADAWPTMSTVEAVFCEVFGVTGQAFLARKHYEELIQTVCHAEAIVIRIQSEDLPHP